MKKQKTQPKNIRSKRSASKVKTKQKLAFESEFFTIRSIKEQATEKGATLVIVSEPESNISKDGSRTKFEIPINEQDEVAMSARSLTVGDIVSVVIIKEDIDVGLHSKVESPFVKVEELIVEGILALDPVNVGLNGNVEAFLLLNEYSMASQLKNSMLDWRKVHIPAKYMSSINKLKAGKRIKVKCHPITYFNHHTNTNDIMWKAMEKVHNYK